MTKRQVLFSLRERVNHLREICERDKSGLEKIPTLYEYNSGRIDAYDLVLEMFCDYD